MNKACLIIGVDDYSDSVLSNLPGCAADAERLFSSLTDPEMGGYNETISQKMISPSLEEIRNAFTDFARIAADLEVFTFAFSGHGGVVAGKLYLCANNTDQSLITSTALSLSYVFDILSSSSPRQTNIIIDACQSGGIAENLQDLIRPSVLGASRTPGINIFASSASDQSSYANDEGSFAISEILKGITGENRIQTHKPHLNLIEIGTAAATNIKGSTTQQEPVVWGLNLFGDPFFTQNPHFEGDGLPYSYTLAGIPAKSNAGQILQQESGPLWEVYKELQNTIEPRCLIDAIDFPCKKLSAKEGAVSAFVIGLSQTLPTHATSQSNLFAKVETLASCMAPLLAYAEQADVHDAMSKLGAELSYMLHDAMSEARNLLSSECRSLLSLKGGTSDLYVLPMRITKFLGWAGANRYLARVFCGDTTKQDTILGEIADFIIEHYSLSLVCISDLQSAPMLPALMEMHEAGHVDQANTIFGCLFSSYVESHGLITSYSVKSEHIPEFLLCRSLGKKSLVRGMYAQPDHTLAVLMHFAGHAGMDDVVDPHLSRLDHKLFNAFLPDTHVSFSDALIEDGVNVSFQIGSENEFGVFITSDFKDCWEKYCATRLRVLPASSDVTIKALALCVSLLLPDRVSWISYS